MDFLSALYPLLNMCMASSSKEAGKAGAHIAQLYTPSDEIIIIYGSGKTAAPVSLFR